MKQMSTRMVNAFQKGFTLIELVIVLVVLGVLAAFAIPQFVGLQDDADAAGAAANLASLVTQAYSSTLATGGDLGAFTVGGVTLDLSADSTSLATCPLLASTTLFEAAGIVDSDGNGRDGEFTIDNANTDSVADVSFTIPVEPNAGVAQSHVCWINKD